MGLFVRMTHKPHLSEAAPHRAENSSWRWCAATTLSRDVVISIFRAGEQV
jgi:hypothetical protein